MYRELYEKAKEAYVNAYAPYSKLHVGAAILCGDGTVFTGVNVENASYGAGICAERSAAVTAVTHGHRDFRVIAICSDAGEAWPCGICRQFLYEFAPDMKVVTGSDAEHLEILGLAELLPKGWTL
ncbi:MAG: cytidine deaminase [Eubacteriaceae bacterium]|jgi:cytidine deaminase|nr:cytidine deaminase [Eubacteriaceae bacterium]